MLVVRPGDDAIVNLLVKDEAHDGGDEHPLLTVYQS